MGIVVLSVVALVWLGYESWRLLLAPWPLADLDSVQRRVVRGAIDLLQRHTEVHEWYRGLPLYGVRGTAVYPPASLALLWPLVGWLSFPAARWVWAASTVVALAWLVSLTVRESAAEGPRERTFVTLVLLSMYAVGATIGNGQVTIHSLVLSLAGMLLLRRGQPISLRRDLAASALVLCGLVKVTLAAPFFWFVLFVPGRIRPAALVISGYLILSVAATARREEGCIELHKAWLHASTRGAEYGAGLGAAANLHTLLSSIAEESADTDATPEFDEHGGARNWRPSFWLEDWLSRSSVVLLALLGLWTFRYRRGDPWCLIGVAAIVARFWTYHMWYDDLLILLPMIALYRICRRDRNDWKTCIPAALLLALALPAMLAPGGQYVLPPPLRQVYMNGLVLLWAAMAILLHLRVQTAPRPMSAGTARSR